MKKLALAALAGVICSALVLLGVVPLKWEVRAYDDYLKGKLDGLSVNSDGVLSLSLKEDRIQGPAEDFYLSFLPGPDNSLFLGTGHSGKIYRIAKEGTAELYYQTQEMDVTCLALDKKGNLYAGTSPNGRIYKITGKDKGETFFNPDEKYIWDLAFTEKDSLLAAVGEAGGIYEISPQGEGNLILKATENHILCLKVADDGDIIAGSGGGGSIYRLSQGKTSLLFESSFEEVKSIALDKEGNIYAGAGGTLTRTKKEEPSLTPLKPAVDVAVTVTPAGADISTGTSSAQKEPSALFRIGPEGLSKKLWNSGEELIYTLTWDEAQKRVIFGTGNKGRIYAVGRDEKTFLLIQETSEQVYELYPQEQKIYVISNNPASLSLVAAEQRSSGEYLSAVMDSKTVSSWGKLEWEAGLPEGTSLQFQTRSGNAYEPNKTWSDWSPPYQKKEEQILSPKARYLQFKALLKSETGKVSPQVQRVALFYLQANLPPAISRLELLSPNEVFIKPLEQDEVIWGLEKAKPRQEAKKGEGKILMVPKKAERQGYQTLQWDAEDENGDELVYSLYIKKEGEAQWRVLEDQWEETIYTFDTVSFPDGVYFIKLEASDRPSNPAGTELKSEKISTSLTIDNSLPVIKDTLVMRDKNSLEVSFQAEDSYSPIERAEFLIRPGEWRVIFPTDGICDSKLESFKFEVSLPSNSDNLITVRIFDQHHNMGVFRQTF